MSSAVRSPYKYLLLAAFAVLLSLFVCPHVSWADDTASSEEVTVVAEGTCSSGGDLNWTLTSDGVLEINGQYAMADYSDSGAPWYAQRSQIKEVHVNISEYGTIGAYAFSGCVNLTSLKIAGEVTSIGQYAFSGCSKLSMVEFPASLTTIGFYAFNGCSNIQDFYYGGSIEQWITDTSYNNSPGQYAEHVYFGSDKQEAGDSITIPKSVKTLRRYLFDNSKGAFDNIKTITFLSADLNEIQYSAFPRKAETVYYPGTVSDWMKISFDSQNNTSKVFFNGTQVTEIAFPEQTEAVPAYAFSFFDGITKVTLPASVTSIGSLAFPAISEGFYYQGAKADWIAIERSGSIFKNPANVYFNHEPVTSLVIPRTLETVPSYCFSGFKNLETVQVEDGVKNLGQSAFYACSNLKSVSLGNQVQTIAKQAFSYCQKLHNINIPASVTTIETGSYNFYQPFYGCTSAVVYCEDASAKSGWSSKWNNSVKKTLMNVSYDDYCLWQTLSVEPETTIPEGIRVIPAEMFAGETTITSVNIPDSVVEIGAKAFSRCSNLAEINLPARLEMLGSSAFANCTKLRQIYIPESVSVIQESPFLGCAETLILFTEDDADAISQKSQWSSSWNYYKSYSRISRISYDVRPEEYAVCAPNDTNKTEADLTGLTKIPDYAFYNCPALATLKGQTAVTSVGDHAFENCMALDLKTNVFTDSLETIGTNAFYKCGGSELVIPDSVRGIGENAFYSMPNLRKVTLGTSVQSIGKKAFSDCPYLLKVTFANNDVTIAENAFASSGSKNGQPGTKIDFVAPSYDSTAYAYYEANQTKINFSVDSCEHEWETAPYVAPTCTEPGKQEGQKCKRCGLDKRVRIPATGHTPADAVRENETLATCTAEGGYDEVVYCANPGCGKELSREHKTIDKLAHVMSVHQTAHPASCTEDGNIEYWTCEICGNSYADEAGEELLAENGWVLPAAGHDWGEWIVTKEPTDTESGEKIRTCKRDASHTEMQKIPSLLHVHGLVKTDAKDATCTEDGNVEYWTCTEGDFPCGLYFKDADGIEAFDSFSDTVVKAGHRPAETVKENVVEATCSSLGSYEEVVYCSVCGEELSRETKIQEKTAHTPETIPGYPATETEEGLTDGSRCAVCGTVLKAQEAIPKLTPEAEKKPSAITLTKKTVTYNGKPQTIGEAAVEGSTGKITYTYFKDAACKNKADKVVNAGTYYVKATVEADTEYASAESDVSTLVVRKGTSSIALGNKTIVAKINKKNKATPVAITKARVQGTSGKVTYTYYMDAKCKKKTTKKLSGAKGTGQAPALPGVYYVIAKASADGNWNAVSSKPAKYIVQPKVSYRFQKKEGYYFFYPDINLTGVKNYKVILLDSNNKVLRASKKTYTKAMEYGIRPGEGTTSKDKLTKGSKYKIRLVIKTKNGAKITVESKLKKFK